MGLKLNNSDKIVFSQLEIGDIFTSGQILAIKVKPFKDDIVAYNAVDLSNGEFLFVFEGNNARIINQNDSFTII